MPNTKELDEGERPMNEAKGQPEEASDTTSSTNESERDEGRSARERRVYAEKKAASVGLSRL
jgi:hypothetical protein